MLRSEEIDNHRHIKRTFIEYMNEMHEWTDFSAHHEYLRRIFDEYPDVCYKEAVYIAIRESKHHKYPIDAVQGMLPAFRQFLNQPNLSQHAIELNAWRVYVQIFTGKKLAELWKEYLTDLSMQ